MKVITTTAARKDIRRIVDHVKHRGGAIGIGRRNSIDAVLIGFPHAYNKDLDDITNVNAYSRSFGFLGEEPELYSVNDLSVRYD